MNMKDMLWPVVMALGSFLLVQHFFSPAPQTNQQGSEFVAPKTAQAVQPLNLDVDFIDAEKISDAVNTVVETAHATWRFSTHGAQVENLTYKRVSGSIEQIFNTISPQVDKEKNAFLLAFNGIDSTPYYYTLVGKEEGNDQTLITYQADAPHARITKQFAVPHNSYNLGLTIIVEPKDGAVLQPRILFPAPQMHFEDRKDELLGVVYSDRYGLSAKKLKDIDGKGWEYPPLFGAEDRYFAHVLVKDLNSFVRRGYFNVGQDNLQAIIEGPSVKEKTTWQLSFYCGPKESEALASGDPRLEGLLDYGWFSMFSKPLLYLLKLLYGYVHNYGFAIILLTLLINLFMLPMTMKSERAMKTSAEVQRKMAYLDQKYKHDPEMLAREKAELMKKHGMSMLGCLPIFLQIPIFVGLQRVLGTSLELYKAPFLWIKDLSQADPYYILPVLASIGMIIRMSKKGDAKQNMTMGIMAIVVAALMSAASAGLTLFLSANTLIGSLLLRLQKSVRL